MHPTKVCSPLPWSLADLRPLPVYLPTCTRACVGLPRGSVVKNLPAKVGDAGDVDLIPGLGRFPEGGNGDPLQYSCLENSMDRGAWWAIAQGVARVGYDWAHTHTHTRTHTHTLVAHFSRPLIFSGRWIHISLADCDWLRYYFPDWIPQTGLLVCSPWSFLWKNFIVQ